MYKNNVTDAASNRNFQLAIASRWSNPRPKSLVFKSKSEGCHDSISTVYVINLDRQRERWRRYEKEARFVELEGGNNLLDLTKRISAVDAKQVGAKPMNPDVMETYRLSDQYFVDGDERWFSILQTHNPEITMSAEEVAIALSHISVWRKIVEDRCSYALILEDDIYFESSFSAFMNEAWYEMPKGGSSSAKFDVLYVSYIEPKRRMSKNYVSRHLFRPESLWLLSGYVLSYKGAQKLLDLLPVCSPLDIWINQQFNTLEVLATTRSLIHQCPDLKSDNVHSIRRFFSEMGAQFPDVIL